MNKIRAGHEFENVRCLADRYGWSFEDAVRRLNEFFDIHARRVDAGVINWGEMLAMWREHHMRVDER